MKGYIKNQTIENLNKFLKDNNIEIDQLFDIVIYHEKLPIDKTKVGLRKKIENLKVELEYQKILKELQALDYDRATVQRETVADFLCDLFVRMRILASDKNPFADNLITYEEITKLRNEYLKMFAIPEQQFQDIFDQAYNRAMEQEKGSAAMPSPFEVKQKQLDEDIVDEMNAIPDQKAVNPFEADEVHGDDPGSIFPAMKAFDPNQEDDVAKGPKTDPVDHLKEMSKHLKEHKQEEAAEVREEEREIRNREAEETSATKS